jgi:hypothetical protein
MLRFETQESWEEWVMLTQAEATDTCMRCGGWGDHGVEEETGCLYTCYACGETGKYFPVSEAMPQ